MNKICEYGDHYRLGLWLAPWIKRKPFVQEKGKRREGKPHDSGSPTIAIVVERSTTFRESEVLRLQLLLPGTTEHRNHQHEVRLARKMDNLM